MQNKIVLALLMTALITASAFALEIKGTAPTLVGGGFVSDSTSINCKLKQAFDDALDEMRDQMGAIKSKPEALIKAFGDAGIFASHGATQRAYGGYKTFAVTFGPMVGLRLPGSPFTLINDLSNLSDKLAEEQDLKLGINPQVINAHIGINTSKFLLKDLYLGLHFGYMKLDNDTLPLDEISFGFNNFSLGATVNYQLVAPVSRAKGLFLWRGVNVGSGFIYQKTNISAGLGMDEIEQGFDSGGKLTIAPALSLNFNIDTFVIPIEVNTAVRLLWFLNIPLGVGVDLGFGKSDLKIGMDAKITAELSGYPTETPGTLSVKAGGDMPPSFFNMKLMSGVGINLGPVVIDVPVTWYFIDNGYSVGVSVGFVW